MQHQEVANRVDIRGKDAVELFGGFRVAVARRKERQELCDTTLYQVNARRFQRLEETARQTDGDDVLIPCLSTPAREETNQPGGGERFTVKVGAQSRGGLIVTAEVAAVDDSVTSAMLQGNAPVPPGSVRSRACVGNRVLYALARHRQSAIARKP